MGCSILTVENGPTELEWGNIKPLAFQPCQNNVSSRLEHARDKVWELRSAFCKCPITSRSPCPRLVGIALHMSRSLVESRDSLSIRLWLLVNQTCSVLSVPRSGSNEQRRRRFYPSLKAPYMGSKILEQGDA